MECGQGALVVCSLEGGGQGKIVEDGIGWEGWGTLAGSPAAIPLVLGAGLHRDCPSELCPPPFTVWHSWEHLALGHL